MRLSLFAVPLLVACSGGLDLPASPLVSGGKGGATEAVMRWDHVPEGRDWTRATLAALDGQGQKLLATWPADMGEWCPGLREDDAAGRKLFWTGLLSALAKHESTWNAKAVGGGGRWFGLVQISPATARYYGCEAGSGAALKDGAANLSCAVRILDTTVPRDGVIATGKGGIAADWGPFRQSAKRADMQSWMRAQDYCR
ncbi:MAG: lytic transglycosylase [Rhodobacterales bacterium]|nr:MAG: lytic transglycosylase [Rhodobacterales bacterium]